MEESTIILELGEEDSRDTLDQTEGRGKRDKDTSGLVIMLIAIKEICIAFLNSGFRMMEGHLLSRGYRLPQVYIRESLHRVDPEGVAASGPLQYKDKGTQSCLLFLSGTLMATTN